MVIREYQPTDCKEIIRLFYDTVHSVNAKDYTEEQLNAWTTGKADILAVLAAFIWACYSLLTRACLKNKNCTKHMFLFPFLCYNKKRSDHYVKTL